VTFSDGVAFLALVISGLTFFHTRKQSKISQRPTKLEAYRLTKEFVGYCSKYKTMYSYEPIMGTRELWSEIDSFSWNLDKLGPTEITGFSDKTSF